MKGYTDLEQSRELKKILPLESADMIWVLANPDLPMIRAIAYEDSDYNNKYYEILPAWSLSALLGLMPTDDKKDEYYVTTESHSDYYTVNYRNCWDGCIHSEYSEESLLDASFKMICWLKENGKI